jgi:hypothetical protein
VESNKDPIQSTCSKFHIPTEKQLDKDLVVFVDFDEELKASALLLYQDSASAAERPLCFLGVANAMSSPRPSAFVLFQIPSDILL